jgi:hypothetical protein
MQKMKKMQKKIKSGNAVYSGFQLPKRFFYSAPGLIHIGQCLMNGCLQGSLQLPFTRDNS